MGISKKAMIVKLHISSWKGQIKDLKVTSKTQLVYGASTGSGVYNKFLVAKRHLKDVQTAENDARRFHIKNTVPWNDGGDRLLPAKNWLKYSKGMRSQKAKFEVAVGKFCSQYPLIITNANKFLGTMYYKHEYPDPNFIKDRFAFFTDMTPVPVSGDFRVEMEEADKKRIKEELDDKNVRSQEQAMTNLWERLYNAVKTMADGISGDKGKVYDAYIKNIEELTEILPDLNITNDQKLNDMSHEIRHTLTAHTPGQLRKDKRLKKETADKAGAMMNKLDGMMGGASAIK